MEIIELTNKDPKFYLLVGKYLANRTVAKELGMPAWDDDDKVWVIALENNKCVGFSAFVIKKKKAILKSSWIVPEYRNRWIYSCLFGYRIKLLSDKVSEIESIATEMSKNTHFRYGFELIGMKGKYYHFRKVK